MICFLKSKFLCLVSLLALVNLCLGCSLARPRPVVQKGMDKIRPETIIQREKRISAPGPPPFSERVGPVTKGLAKEERLYSLSFDNAPLGEVVRAIIRATDLSLSVESGVDINRPVTVNLKNCTLREALDMVVVKGAGYAWKIEEGCLQINRFEERIYAFDYLDMAGEVDVEVGGDMLGTSIEGAGVSGKYQVKVKKDAITVDVWARVKAALERIKSLDGILQINRTSGIIYMADTPRKIAAMVRFLDSLLKSLHRQVFIEARILEVQLSETYRHGIDWGHLDVALNPNIMSSSGPDTLDINFNRGGTIVLNQVTKFGAIVDFLSTQGDVTVLSNPHLFVMNGQSAMMTVGLQFPFGDIEGVSRDEETGVVTIDASIKRAVLGLQMGITPQISEDGIITLHVVPTITRIRGEEQVEIPTTATTSQTISNPVIQLQELATTVRVREGQSVVLAGLISQLRELNTSGLPWLSSIPVLGHLFKNLEKKTENTELVILIRPHIREVI